MELYNQAYSDYLVDFVLSKDTPANPKIFYIRKNLARSIINSPKAQKIVLESIVKLYPVVTAELADKKDTNSSVDGKKPLPLLKSF